MSDETIALPSGREGSEVTPIPRGVQRLGVVMVDYDYDRREDVNYLQAEITHEVDAFSILQAEIEKWKARKGVEVVPAPPKLYGKHAYSILARNSSGFKVTYGTLLVTKYVEYD